MATREEIEAAILHAKKFGHGHVFPRTDGVRARCGGGSLCPQCKADAELLATAKKNEVLWRSEDAAKDIHRTFSLDREFPSVRDLTEYIAHHFGGETT